MTPRDASKASFACVIPCYNAGDRVRPVLDAAKAQTPNVIVVDDGCTDSCLEGADLRIVRHDRNRGKGHAILTGLREALALDVEGIALLDADGQHDPGVLPEFWTALRDHQADLVIGARIFDGGHVPLRSRVGNTVTAWVTRTLLGKRLDDTQCGYRMLSRGFAQDVVDHVAGGRYETEMEMLVRAIRGRFKLVSLPIETIYEEGNKSSHFNKIGDSTRIYLRLVRSVMRK